VYTAIASLDGYVNDADGAFERLAPDEEVHRFANELGSGVGTHVYGRRMYDVMQVWQTMPDGADEPAVVREYADIWRGADKVVYSRTLDAASTPRTRLERELDAPELRRLVDAADRDVSIGGPTLAGQALAAGIVDEVHLLLCPVLLGGGTRALPDGVRLDLELVGERRFGSGVVHLHHRVRRG
jgi:dihydrofolate reductase